MAHELTFKDGVAEMFTVRQPAWHREGKVLEFAPDFDQAMQVAGLDFQVEKTPAFRRTIRELEEGGSVQEFAESERAFLTFRTDTQQELGSVGRDYQILQNRDAFGQLEPLLDSGLAKLETGGSLRDGADAWMLVRFNLETQAPEVAQRLQGDLGIMPYGLIANNHSGRRGALLSTTPVRVVCANTLSVAENGVGRTIVLRHTGDVEAKATEAAMSLFEGIVERYTAVAEQYEMLKRTYLSLAQFRSLVVDELASDPRLHSNWNPEARMATTVVGRYEAKVDRLEHLWNKGDGHQGDGSAWEAYNGAVQSLDHDTEMWPTRGGVYRTASLIDGGLANRKQAVLQNLVGVARDPLQT